LDSKTASQTIPEKDLVEELVVQRKK